MDQENLPTVAVLMTLYRRDRLDFFHQAMASLAAQDYPQDRTHLYLAVDGPVPEAHEVALAKHAGRLFRLWRRPTNNGLAVALNELLDQLGDEAYLLRMDGDDIALPSRIRTQVEFMERHPEIDLVGANANDIDETGAIVRPRHYPEPHERIVRVLPKLNPVLHPTYCIRGATMRRDRVRYPDAFLTEDWAFLFEAVRRGWRLHNLQATLLHWRTSGDFFLRRSGLRRGWQEFKTISAGTWQICGVSPQLVWPLVRFGFRLLPAALVRRAYRSNLRRNVVA
jgi:glycosyltransferase involved in cell wall biosynthesis